MSSRPPFPSQSAESGCSPSNWTATASRSPSTLCTWRISIAKPRFSKAHGKSWAANRCRKPFCSSSRMPHHRKGLHFISSLMRSGAWLVAHDILKSFKVRVGN